PQFIVGTLMVGNLVMQGGTITGQTAQGGQLEGTLMLVGGGITTLASPTPAVINCLLDMGYETRSVVVFPSTSPSALGIQGPVGDGGLVISAASGVGVVRMSADNRNILPNNYTSPLTFPNNVMPDLGPFQQNGPPPPYPALGDSLLGPDVAITLV